jgi:hypothetical protein
VSRPLAVLGTVVLALVVPAVARAAEPVPTPTLSLPPAGIRGFALWDSWFDLAPFGYEEQEYLVSGTAVDGTGTPKPFTTRIIVTRPSDPADFNGTVVLDWVNVTAQFENAVDSLEAGPMLRREGFAYVHVSAQAAGLCCFPLLTPQMWDPVRYAGLSHPGDDWSFDLFSQIAQAFRSPPGDGSLDPMGDLGVASVEHVLATGQSQSALRLRDYVDQWLPGHPNAVGLVDGILVHGDVFAAKPFAHPLPVKVINLLSDLEAVDDGFDPAAADPGYRLWEVAGAGHSNYFVGHQSVAGHGPRVEAQAPKQTKAQYDATILAAGNYGERIEPELLTCLVAGSAMPMRYVTSSAIQQLHRWVDGGPPPANGPRFQFAGGVQAKDQYGNPLGGIRLPPVDVPVARYQSTVCQLGGITIPFTDVELAGLYGTHAEYYDQMADRTDQAVADGWLLPEDAVDLMQRACAAKIRFPDAGRTCPAYVAPAYGSPLPAPTGPAAPLVDTSGPSALPATGTPIPVVPAMILLLLALTARRLARR